MNLIRVRTGFTLLGAALTLITSLGITSVSAGTVVIPVSYTHLTLPTIYSV